MYFEHLGNNSFFCCRLDDGDAMDNFSYGMLSNNSISNVVPPIFSIENGEQCFRYNVTAKVSLADYFIGVVSKKQILNVFYSIVCGVLETEEYMIEPGVFLLNSDYIFVDPNTSNAYLIPVPIDNNEKSFDICGFFKSILFSLNYNKSEDTNYITEIINFSNAAQNTSLVELKNLLFRLLEDKSASASQPVKKEKASEVKKEVSNRQIINEEKIQKREFVEKEVKKAAEIKKKTDSEESKKQAFDVPINDKKIEQQKPEDKMSLFKLLTNFSKENLEAYKSQKESAQATSTPSKKEKPVSGNTGFAIPGQKAPAIVPENKAPQKEKKTEQKPEKKSLNNASSKSAAEVNQSAKKPIFQKKTETQAAFASSSKDNFGSTMYFDKDEFDSTMYLGSNIGESGEIQQEINPRIIRKSNNEVAQISEFPFKLGKNPDYADFCIKGNPAISGAHALILEQDGEFFIKDTNSKNHVYINGIIVPIGEHTQINHQDIIKLADEDFEFVLY